MSTTDAVIDDLAAESAQLDALVTPLAADGWRASTPAVGWTIAHQIGHLLWTDRVALTSVTDEAAFSDVLATAAANPTGFVDEAAGHAALTPPAQLLAAWRDTRIRLHAELRTVADGRKLLWFGPPMSPASMATARLMETWAHGLDVADALGVVRPATARLRSIAHIGVRTRDFAFTVHGLTPPAAPFHVELRAPDGDQWSWGPADAAQRITASAEDFCMLVTQRRPRAALDVVAEGPDAQRWLDIAQAFAGPPGGGR
jgi:uncharacterized protein (TIGR03084 family)